MDSVREIYLRLHSLTCRSVRTLWFCDISRIFGERREFWRSIHWDSKGCRMPSPSIHLVESASNNIYNSQPQPGTSASRSNWPAVFRCRCESGQNFSLKLSGFFPWRGVRSECGRLYPRLLSCADYKNTQRAQNSRLQPVASLKVKVCAVFPFYTTNSELIV